MKQSASGITRSLLRATDQLTARVQIALLVAIALALQSLLIPAHASRMLVAAAESISALCLPIASQAGDKTDAPGRQRLPLVPDLDKCWICQYQTHAGTLPFALPGPVPTNVRLIASGADVTTGRPSPPWHCARPEPRAPPQIA